MFLSFKALEIIKKTNLPAVITIAPMGENKMRDNWSIVDLEQRGADVLIQIRKAVKLIRTNIKHQTFFNLPETKISQRTIYNRYEIAKFSKQLRDLGGV